MGAKPTQTDQSAANPNGSKLTEEQISDVYTAGTSDGIIQGKNDKLIIEQEGYETKPNAQSE